MGWTGCSAWRTKAAVIAAILAECYTPGSGYVAVETASTRSGLWVVAQLPDGSKAIQFFLIEKVCGEYAHKSMDEAMGPYTYDCPLAFLDMVPEACASWRKSVRAFHASKLQTFAVGDKVSIYGKPYKVVGLRTTATGRAGGYLVQDPSGNVYRSTATKMVPAHAEVS